MLLSLFRRSKSAFCTVLQAHANIMQKIQALSTAQKRWYSLEKNYKKVLACVWEGLREYFSTSGAESLHVGGARQIDKICNLKNDLSLRSIISQSSWLRGTTYGDSSRWWGSMSTWHAKTVLEAHATIYQLFYNSKHGQLWSSQHQQAEQPFFCYLSVSPPQLYLNRFPYKSSTLKKRFGGSH